jgi:hypothetical protein
MSTNRRQWPRLVLTEEAYAVDSHGRKLGRVALAGGGGMLITAKTSEEASTMRPGERLLVTIMEPRLQTQHHIDVIVRYQNGAQVGVEFITGPDTE